MGRDGDAQTGARPYIGFMNRRTALLAPLFALAIGLPAQAEPIPLDRLSTYLNELETAEAEFTQINSDGSMSTGTLYIKRPGRARFEYAPPDRALVMAGGGQVAIFDAKSNQPPEQYPLKRTPLNLILERTVDLGRAKMVVGHYEAQDTTRVVAQDPENPEYGTIELIFTDNPVALRQWVITDDLGNKTDVILDRMATGGDLPSSLFNITIEREKRGQ